jgi:uncharacterized membrane protein YidH (DUF202 family)
MFTANLDKKQQIYINVLIAAVGVTTAIIGYMAYRDNKKHQALQQELLGVDKEIKLLQLAEQKNKAMHRASKA